MDAIQIKDLEKSYGDHQVLKKISFNVKKGEIFAILGVNGAGKTTTLECIEGLRRYEHGTISVHGSMGIQLQSSSLPEHIKPLEAIQFFAKWKKAKVDEAMLNRLHIQDLSKKQYVELSTGQVRRLHLALALLGDPDIIFLDEPTAGLDVEGRVSLHEQIKELKEQGKTIILASHDMAEVEVLCDRIAILNQGKIAFLGTIQELNESVGKQYTIEIDTTQGKDVVNTDDISETLLTVLANYKKNHIAIHDIRISRGSLEQHFMELSRRETK